MDGSVNVVIDPNIAECVVAVVGTVDLIVAVVNWGGGVNVVIDPNIAECVVAVVGTVDGIVAVVNWGGGGCVFVDFVLISPAAQVYIVRESIL